MTETLDLETRLTDADHQALRLWLRLLSCTVKLEDEIKSRLRSEFDTTLPRFDLMAQLERHPQGLRMGELSKRMMVTGGNLTGIADQLEREGLILRLPDPLDRRACSLQLTEEGRHSFARMAVAHETWIIALFGGLNVQQKTELHDLLALLKQNEKSTGNS